MIAPNKLKKNSWERFYASIRNLLSITVIRNKKIISKCSQYSMISDRSFCKLIELVKILNDEKITGSFVECGVWKGGACMVMALAQTKFSRHLREIWLYDTYEGMTKPHAQHDGLKAIKKYEDVTIGVHKDKYDKWHSELKWIFSPIELVRENMYSTGYQKDKIRFIKGNVIETLDKLFPTEIALLRLDTDWYESTKKELEVLSPLLKVGGFLIVDDYYAWPGAQKAVDEFMLHNNKKYVIVDNKPPNPLIFRKISHEKN